MKKINYQEMLPDELLEIIKKKPVAYFPLGTLEYHGPHLPVGNDGIKAEEILKIICKKTGGILLPTLYWGIGGGHKDYPASIIIKDHLLEELLEDIFEGLYRTGFKIIVVLTGHYPPEQLNAVKNSADKFLKKHPDIKMLVLAEFEAYKVEKRADHAGKWETSILMYLKPELVNMKKIRDAGGKDAPEGNYTLEDMNKPGPLHGILGENPCTTANKKLGKQTVIVIVSQIENWVNTALSEIR